MSSTWYVDPIGGLDTNTGTSFAQRYQNLNTAVTSASAGDSIRVIGSPNATDMGQTASFTFASKTVTLTTAVTSNIYLDGAWTANSNSTCTADTTLFRQGSNSSKNVITTGAASGTVLEYFNTGTLNLSAYQQISLWIRFNTAISSTFFKLRLSSTTNGTTATHEFNIPGMNVGATWSPITFNNGSNLSSSIASVALVTTATGYVANTINIDNIVACKATSSVDSLTLNSVIGINDGNWYGIQSINGTGLVIDSNFTTSAANGQGYAGTTNASAEIYKQEPLYVAQSGTWTNVGTKTGSAGNLITISGGWDTTAMSSQSLNTTWIDFQGASKSLVSGAQTGLSYNTLSFTRSSSALVASNITSCTFNEITMTDSNPFFASTATATSCIFSYITCNACTAASTSFFAGSCVDCNLSNIILNSITTPSATGTLGSSMTSCILNTITCNNGNFYGISGQGSNSIYYNITCNSNVEGIGNNGNLVLQSCRFYNLTLSNNSTYGLAAPEVFDTIFYSLTGSGNTSGDVNHTSSFGNAIILINDSLSSSTKIHFNAASTANFPMTVVYEQYIGGSNTVHKESYTAGTISSNTSTTHAASGFSWQFSPTNTTVVTSTVPLSKRIATIPVASGVSATISVWCYSTNSSTITQTIRIPGGRIPGVGSPATDITATNGGATNTWTQVTLAAVTPTVDGVIEVYCDVYSTNTTDSAYTHDFVIT